HQQRDDLKAKLVDAQQKLAAKMETLAAGQADWEKKLIARYEAGELTWKTQRPTSAESANGAVLKIYNDEQIDYTIYDGSFLKGGRAPGDGLVVASGPNPDNETYTVKFQPGAGTWTALGVEIVQDESLPGLRVARGADRMVLTEVD